MIVMMTLVDWTTSSIGTSRMLVEQRLARRRFLGLLASGSGLLGLAAIGCGSSVTKLEISPQAKKALVASKIGDTSKFKKSKGRNRP
jgi:hypothetical protein